MYCVNDSPHGFTKSPGSKDLAVFHVNWVVNCVSHLPPRTPMHKFTEVMHRCLCFITTIHLRHVQMHYARVRFRTWVHICKISNYLLDKGHHPGFSTPVLQFVVEVQLCVWICLCLYGQTKSLHHKHRQNITTVCYDMQGMENLLTVSKQTSLQQGIELMLIKIHLTKT